MVLSAHAMLQSCNTKGISKALVHDPASGWLAHFGVVPGACGCLGLHERYRQPLRCVFSWSTDMPCTACCITHVVLCPSVGGCAFHRPLCRENIPVCREPAWLMALTQPSTLCIRLACGVQASFTEQQPSMQLCQSLRMLLHAGCPTPTCSGCKCASSHTSCLPRFLYTPCM